MNNAFLKLSERIIDSLNDQVINESNMLLNEVQGNVIIIGTGGSFAIAKFTERVLEAKNNNCFAVSLKPRDLLSKQSKRVDYVIAFTYSGKTPSIIAALNKMNCKKIIFTFNAEKLKENLNYQDDCSIIDYCNTCPKEKSFISISSTLIPMFLMYSFYQLKIEVEKMIKEAEIYIQENFKNINFLELLISGTIEIMTGDETYTAATILESNLIESGIAYSICHEKNDYSHGRSILNYVKHTDVMFYFQNGEEQKQDIILYKYINKFYNNVFIISSNYGGILGELDLALKSMFLSKKIALDLNIDLTKINYPEEIRDIYKFKL